MPKPKIEEWVWNMHEPLIRDLHSRFSLPEIKQIMSERHNFNPTERMYKSRMQKWGVPPKNLQNRVYQAMERLSEPLMRQNPSSKLIEWRTHAGYNEKSRPLNNITKETRRARGTQHERVQMSLREAHEIVTTVRQTEVRFFYDQTEVDLDDLVAWGEALEERSTSIARSSPGRVSCSVPASPTSVSPNAVQLLDASGALRRRYSLGSTSSPSVGASIVGLYAVSSGHCPRCPASCVHEDYEFDSEYRSGGITMNNARMHPPIGLSSQKSLVGLWVVPLVIKAMSNTRGPNKTLCMSSSASQDRLRNVLDTPNDNKFFLPGLNWAMCVLLYNGRYEPLETMVQEACTAVEMMKGPNSFLFLPFRFTLAWIRDDGAAMEGIGQQFEYAYSKARGIFGEEDGDTLVLRLYLAWYKRVCQKDPAAAKLILEKMLPILRKKFGGHHTLTINAHQMLGRCCMDMRNSWQALAAFDDTLHYLGLPDTHMEAYQLHVLFCKAQAEIETAQLEQAERHLETVVRGRLKLLGLAHPDNRAQKFVWEAIWSLTKVKVQLGKQADADKLEERYKLEYAQARQEWYTTRGYKVPPDDTTWAKHDAMAVDQPMVRHEGPPSSRGGQGH